MCRGLDALMLRVIGPPASRPCSRVLRNGPTRNRTENLLITYPPRLAPPLGTPSVWSLDFAFTFAVTRSGGCRQVSTPSPFGAWLGVGSLTVRRL